MKEAEQLNIPLNNKENYIIKRSVGMDIPVTLMEKKLEGKYLILTCKKEELNISEVLKINGNNEQEYNIDLQKNERNIIQIKSNNKIYTFVQIFCDDDISKENFTDSKDLVDYKGHIDELNKEENKINKKSLCIIIPIIFLFIFMAVFALKFDNQDKQDIEDIEEEDDPVLNYLIKITNMNYKNEKNIKI